MVPLPNAGPAALASVVGDVVVAVVLWEPLHLGYFGQQDGD